MRHMRAVAVACAVAAIGFVGFAVAQEDDPYIWLEDAHGERAMAWVQAENAKTTAVLEKDPHYTGLYADALAIAQAKDRIPGPGFLNGGIFNFWQDADHVRGI